MTTKGEKTLGNTAALCIMLIGLCYPPLPQPPHQHTHPANLVSNTAPVCCLKTLFYWANKIYFIYLLS